MISNIDTADSIPAIDIRDLRVDYGDFVAVDDITLSVPRGEVFGRPPISFRGRVCNRVG